ncbi:hypothetical protein D5R93_02180 [Actinomyces lilanjuaniae]|uniref:ESX-1 secretion-associated protein n=1 Tax=Actinomyces lilanjuaniae TaxID=2321394 RepID=A0ABN5PLF1_9ACTO|nr:type VII secretion target [Actinomyces lilanjuaniae]AYD89155.1 hypothetical protein D5R93_02180 [Actinomyces lilanjuaniae]
MSDLSLDPDILNSLAARVDMTADDLDSVTFTSPADLGPSTGAVSGALQKLGSRVTSAASSARSTATSMRSAARQFTDTDEAVAQGAHSIEVGGAGRI